MTKLTSGRLLSERAVIAVSRLLNRIGAVGESIRNDFGEDLFVQTQLKGEVDHFSLLIQVKGTSVAPRNGRFQLRFQVDHLRRWVGHALPVLVCVYNDLDRRIYAFSPRDLFTMWELWTTDRKSFAVWLDDESIFDSQTARRHVWRRRLDHFARSMRDIEYRLESNQRWAGSASTRARLQKELGIVSFHFLDALGLILPDRLSPKYLARFRRCVRNFARENQTGKHELSVSDAVSLVLLAHAEDTTGQGLVETLIAKGSLLLAKFLEEFHSKDWLRAGNLLPNVPVDD